MHNIINKIPVILIISFFSMKTFRLIRVCDIIQIEDNKMVLIDRNARSVSN